MKWVLFAAGFVWFALGARAAAGDERSTRNGTTSTTTTSSSAAHSDAIVVEVAPTVTLAPSSPAQSEASTTPTLADELRAAIALTTPNARRTAALALLRRKDASLANVLLAIEASSPRAGAAPGQHVMRASIFAAGKVEDVEVYVFVPSGYDPAVPAPLILAFHGTGGSGQGQDRMWRATCDKLGALVIAPSEAGANEGYAFTPRERDAAIGALRFAVEHFAVDTNRIVATGISRGGHLAWDVALRRPDRFAAIAPLLGCPRFQMVRGQNNLRFLENLVHVPIRDLQGSKDDPGVLQNLHEAFARLAELKADDAKLIEFADRGHDFDFSAVDWVEFLGDARRDPQPDKIVFTSANIDEARAFWVEILQFTRDVAENPRLDVRQAEWTKLDAAGQRRYVQARVDEDTARIAVLRTGTGRFEVAARGVQRFRLLLTREMFDPAQPVEVLFGDRTYKKRVSPDARVLLAEYVERLDRSFLPIASIEVP